MGIANKWLEKEMIYLKDNWGKISLSHLSIRLKRTEIGICIKAKRLKLGGSTRADEYLTANQASEMINVDRHNLKAIKKKTLFVKMFSLIRIDDFTKWLENNQDKFNSRKIELFNLGCEPQWLKDKRKKDKLIPINNFKKWTNIETQRLIFYSKEMPYKEIAKLMGRSYNSIDKKIYKIRKLNQF